MEDREVKQATDRGPAAGGDPPPLGKVFDFLRLIWAVEQGLNGLSRRMEKELGISGPQRLALRIVGRLPGIPTGMLADLLRIRPATLTGVLQRLVEQGLIERRLDPRDGRRVLLGLTARGRSLDTPAPGTVEDSVERALHGLPQQKVETAREVLEGLLLALEETARAGDHPARPGPDPGAPQRLRRHGAPPPERSRRDRTGPGSPRPGGP